MKNFCLKIVTCVLLLSVNRVEASDEDISKLSFQQKVNRFAELCGGVPSFREMCALTEHNINEMLLQKMADMDNQEEASTVKISVFYPRGNSLLSFHIDEDGDIIKGELYRVILERMPHKSDIKSNFISIASYRIGEKELDPGHVPAHRIEDLKFYPCPYHLKKWPHIRFYVDDLTFKKFQGDDIKADIISTVFNSGYPDPYAVYVALGVLESRGADMHSDEILQKVHENILQFISRIHPLQVQSDDDVVSITGREKEKVLYTDSSGKVYTIGDLLHDVTVRDIDKFVIDSYAGSTLPFNDDQKREVWDALAGKGFTRKS